MKLARMCTLSALALIAAHASAQNTAPNTPAKQPAHGNSPAPAANQPAAMPGMSPEDMKAMEEMAQCMELGKPGAEHADLAKMAGNWSAVCKWYMPSGAAQESSAKSVNTAIFGGRFIKMEYSGSMGPDAPFQGTGLLGYNNVTKQYEQTWSDSVGSGIMFSTGKREGNTYTFTCDMPTPDGKKEKCRMVTTVKSDREHLFEMFCTRDGKESKAMEIAYTREGAAPAAEPMAKPMGEKPMEHKAPAAKPATKSGH